MPQKSSREDWLKKQIENRKNQIKSLQTEIDELDEELGIIEQIKSLKEQIEKIEEEIKAINKQLADDPIDWKDAYEEARWDKNWHAVRIAEQHLREEKILENKINAKKEKQNELRRKISLLEERLKEIYKKILLDETEDTKTIKKK